MKLFVLVRKDMPLAYQAVQAGHAVAQFMICYGNQWQNETLVYLSVDDEVELAKWARKISFIGYSQAGFFEPDMDGHVTAIATTAPEGLFSKLKLMGAE